jgi:hypothetical protein
MSETLRQVVELIRAGQVLISAHGYDEMADDGILASEAIVVWGIPRGQAAPAVQVTACRPDPARLTDDFLRRR